PYPELRPVRARLAVLFGFDRRGQRGLDLERVADDAQVGHLHDRRLGVLVDGDDDLGRLHADRVLHGAGDADRDVHARTHRLARLSDLHRVRHPARVDHCTTGADRAAERAREVLEEGKILWTAHPAPAADHDARVLELDLLRSLRYALSDVRAL